MVEAAWSLPVKSKAAYDETMRTAPAQLPAFLAQVLIKLPSLHATDKQKAFSLVFAVLQNAQAPYEAEAFNLIKKISLHGMTETWSETRKSVSRALAELASKSFTKAQTAATTDELSGLLDQSAADASKWRETEGYVQALTSLVRRYVPSTSSPSTFTFGSESDIGCLPESLRVTESTYSCLTHPQIRVREAAQAYFTAVVKRYDKSEDVEGVAQKVINLLGGSGLGDEVVDGLLSALSILSPFAYGFGACKLDGRVWEDMFSAATKYFGSQASTVRQRSAEATFKLATNWGWTGVMKVLGKMADMMGPEDDIEGLSWQTTESVLISCESLFTYLFNSHLQQMGSDAATSCLSQVTKSASLPAFLAILQFITIKTNATISSPRFELRRISAMILPQISRIRCHVAPSTLSHEHPLTCEVLKAAAFHCRHLEECGLGKVDWGRSHEGIADNESIQMTGGAVADAASKAAEACRAVVSGVKEVVQGSVLKLSEVSGAGESCSVNCSLMEALVVGRAFCGGSGPDIQVCVEQIRVLHRLAYEEASLADVTVSVATSPGVKVKAREADTNTSDLKAADKSLLAALLRVLPTYCALLSTEESASWAYFVTTWIQNGSGSTSWPGTSLTSEAVYLKLLGCLSLLVRKVNGTADSGFYTAVICSLVAAMESGTLKCGSGLLPTGVFRAVLDVIGEGCLNGGALSEKFFDVISGVIKRSGAALSSRAGRDVFKGISVDVKADVVNTLPTTPDKTPHAGEATLNALKGGSGGGKGAEFEVEEEGEDWDDWDESDDDDDDDGDVGGGGGENLYEASLKSLLTKLAGVDEKSAEIEAALGKLNAFV